MYSFTKKQDGITMIEYGHMCFYVDQKNTSCIPFSMTCDILVQAQPCYIDYNLLDHGSSLYIIYSSDARGVLRLLMGVEMDYETMAVYSPSSTSVCLIRTEENRSTNAKKMSRISLPLKRWKMFTHLLKNLMSLVNKVEAGESVPEHKFHLGGNMYATISSNYRVLQVRQFCWLSDEERWVATKKGVKLRLEEVFELEAHLNEFNDKIPKMKDISVCLDDEKHKWSNCDICKMNTEI